MAKYAAERRSRAFKNILNKSAFIDDRMLNDLEAELDEYWLEKAHQLQTRRWRKIRELES